jgi:hypothetical protein
MDIFRAIGFHTWEAQVNFQDPSHPKEPVDFSQVFGTDLLAAQVNSDLVYKLLF